MVYLYLELLMSGFINVILISFSYGPLSSQRVESHDQVHKQFNISQPCCVISPLLFLRSFLPGGFAALLPHLLALTPLIHQVSLLSNFVLCLALASIFRAQ